MAAPVSDNDLALALKLLRQAHSLEQESGRAMSRIVEVAGEILCSTACNLVLVDLANDTAVVQSCWPADSPFAAYMTGRRIALGASVGGGVVRDDDARAARWLEYHGLQERNHPVVSAEIARRYGLRALLGCPILISGALIGYLNHFVSEDRAFSSAERDLLGLLADRAAASMASKRRETVSRSYERLSGILQSIDRASSSDEVLNIVLEGALQLTGKSRGWVSQLDPKTGQLRTLRVEGGSEGRALSYGKGITGFALQEARAVRVDDVHHAPWQKIYEEFWPDTQSELAVPIIIGGALMRKGRSVTETAKRLGVINVESPQRAAFSVADEVILSSLASHAAVVIDRMDLDRKLKDLTRVQQEIVGQEDWDAIVRIVTNAIARTLRYDYVNISVVHPETATIETEHVIGLPQGSDKEFKRRARHRLDEDDIQCHIYRTRDVEVPEADDPRFDKDIYTRFGHDRLIRVFIPMIAASFDRVIGTVDAGYLRADWLPIYEEDVRILRQFVDYAAEALMRRRRGILEEIGHELRAPAVSIRNNVSYMQYRLDRIDKDFIKRKFEDILVDCDILLYQVTELEYFLGWPPRIPKRERTPVFRDVFIAAIQQSKATLMDPRFDPSKIEYDPDDIRRLGTLYVDKTQLKQVVFNLLSNAIKYAEDAPDKFTIRISVDTRSDRDHFIVSFKDWGIGIQKEYADRIFTPGFRTPEAERRNISGSGLGLPIARRIMNEMGGDLRLTQLRKPTEFQVFLPKRLQEESDDSAHR